MKKIFTLILAVMAGSSAFAQATWNDYAADSYAGGTGTKNDPYLISTPEQLAKLSKDCDEGESFIDEESEISVYFKLTEDIDLAGHDWEPIGGYESRGQFLGGKSSFRGVFDGNGKSIKNMTVNKSGKTFEAGLFTHVGTYGEVKNLTIESGKVVCEAVGASIAAICSGSIKYCVNHAEIVSDANTMQGGSAGGICCYLIPPTDGSPIQILGCVNYGNVTSGTGSNGIIAGGIVGRSSASVAIYDCANFGTVKAPTGYAGGILAYVEGNIYSVVNCYNRGEVICNSAATCAGIVGSDNILVQIKPSIYNCYNAARTDGFSILGGSIGLYRPYVNYVYNDKNEFVGDFINPNAEVSVEKYGNYTTDYMKSKDFAYELNTYEKRPNAWVMDTENINDGYPVLKFQNPNATSVDTVKDSDVNIYANGGTIFVEGFDGIVSVYAVTGNLLYSGYSENLADLNLSNGIYIVCVDGVSQKVVIE